MPMLAAIAFLLPSLALTQVPQKLAYEGRLMRADGTPENGVVNFVFALYPAGSGGTAIWTESKSIEILNGYYATVLGDTTSLAGVLDGKEYFLEVSVGGSAMQPRQRVISVPYAVVAGTIAKPCATDQGLRWNGTAWDCAEVGGSSYAQLEGPPQTFAANAWTGITFNAAPISKGITYSQKNITFAKAGTYQITVTFRMDESCGDVWTGARLYGNMTDLGHSAGAGTIPPSPATFTFLATVPAASLGANHQVQIGRQASACTLPQPGSIADTTPPAAQVTITFVNE